MLKIVMCADPAELVLTDHMVLYYLELPKMPPVLGHELNHLEGWMNFLRYEGRKDLDMSKLYEENDALMKAHEKYDFFIQDRASRLA